MKHKVGIDMRMAEHSGIGTYLRGLREGFETTQGFQKPKIGFYSFPAPIYSIREQFLYPFYLKHCKLWHAPHYNIPLFRGKTKLIVTIHDLIHWIFRKQFFSFPKNCYASLMLKQAVVKSDHIITVSEHTRKDLIEHFRANEKKISVIYEAPFETFSKIPKDQLKETFRGLHEKYNIPSSYFLYVGLMKPHKNILWLIKLFRKLKNQGKVQSSLVLVGKKDKSYPKGYEDLSRLESSGDIVYIPGASPPELAALYHQALALVHPSLYEGFGLTLLEAMKSGTPVIASRSSSIPEVTGSAAYLTDPSSEEDMKQALIQLETDVTLRDRLKKMGLEHVQKFSWKKTARETLACYEKVLG